MNNWLDQSSVVVFVEFIAYNSAINRFALIRFFVEFLNTGSGNRPHFFFLDILFINFLSHSYIGRRYREIESVSDGIWSSDVVLWTDRADLFYWLFCGRTSSHDFRKEVLLCRQMEFGGLVHPSRKSSFSTIFRCCKIKKHMSYVEIFCRGLQLSCRGWLVELKSKVRTTRL